MHDRTCFQIEIHLKPHIKVFRENNRIRMKNKYAHLNIQEIISAPYCEII